MPAVFHNAYMEHASECLQFPPFPPFFRFLSLPTPSLCLSVLLLHRAPAAGEHVAHEAAIRTGYKQTHETV